MPESFVGIPGYQNTTSKECGRLASALLASVAYDIGKGHTDKRVARESDY